MLTDTIIIMKCSRQADNIAKMNSSQPQQQPHNRINAFITKHPIGQSHAARLHTRLHSNICKYLHPLKQYYTQHPVQYLVAPDPTYIQKEQHQYKPRLTYQKQMEYYRHSVKHHVQEEYMRQLLDQDMCDRGLMNNIKSTSAMINDILVYANDTTLMSIKINTQLIHNNTMHQNNKQIKYQFGESILQLQKYSNDRYLIVRCRYRIYLFDIHNKTAINRQLDEQITACAIQQQSILITTFDQQQYKLYRWQLNRNQLILLKTCASFWPVHSLLNLNRRQCMLGFANKFIVQDLRINNNRETLRRVMQIGNDRFCAITHKADNSSQFVLSKSHHINVFDIRSPQEDVLSVRHYCQQAPPTCLLSLNWLEPMLIAYSPSQLGSSLLLNLNTINTTSMMNSISSKSTARPILLYDSGKYYKGLHPKSISYFFLNDMLYLFHIDSSNGLSLQVLKKQNKSDIIHLRPRNFVRYPQDPCLKWVQQKQLELYLREKPSYSSESQQQQQSSSQQQIVQSTIFKKHNNYCSLQKFKNRINELAALELNNKGKYDQKQGPEAETYMSSIQQLSSQSQNDWTEIIKYAARSSDPQHKISDKLLQFVEKQWKI